MRKLIYAINLTLDGCCEHTKVRGSEEMLKFYGAMLRECGAFVYGRKTYQLMVPYWPDIATNHTDETKAEIDYANAFIAVPEIVVFSRTLKAPVARAADGQASRAPEGSASRAPEGSAKWAEDEQRTRIVGTDLREEILRLKQQDGKNLMVGGVELASELVRLGLVDEFRIVIQPILGGEGRRLFTDISLQQDLKLIGSETLASGCVALRYEKK